MVTADISLLYTIIQHDDALLALNWAFSQREDIPYIQKFLRLVLEYCLTYKLLLVRGVNFTLKRGVAMGAKFTLNFKFIDDLFLVWAGTEQSLKDLMSLLKRLPQYKIRLPVQ